MDLAGRLPYFADDWEEFNSPLGTFTARRKPRKM
jgi:hypothetical protein